jgi:hypothetical protein
MYHVTQRKINIRKETNISMGVFSIASYISVVVLLAVQHSNVPAYLEIPAVKIALQIWALVKEVMLKMVEYGNITRDL